MVALRAPPMRFSIAEGPEHSDLVAFTHRELNAPLNWCELIRSSPRNPSPHGQRHHESCCRHRRQLPVHRKMLNLKRSHRSHPGKIWAVVDYWTTRGKRSAG